MTFFFAASILTIICLGILIIPQMRNKGGFFFKNDSSLKIYKDQLKEIDRDIEIGRLNQENAGVIRTEIQRRILSADPRKHKNSLKSYIWCANFWNLSTLLILFIIVGATGLYGSLGFLGKPDFPFIGRNTEKSTRSILSWFEVDFKSMLSLL